MPLLHCWVLLDCCVWQLQGMLSPFGELKDCVVIVDKMTQKSKVIAVTRPVGKLPSESMLS
jgi:hypothetical protein